MVGLFQCVGISFLLFPFLYHVASGLKCLSCSNVIQPRHCHYVRECPTGDRCGVVKYVTVSNDIRYDVGCFTNADCTHTKRKAFRELTDNHLQIEGIDHVLCRQCCNSSLCHQNGCGELGFPEDRGLLCYTCKQSTDPRKCEHFSVCNKDEICHLGVKEEFGDNIYTSSCQHKTVCQDPSSIIFGRKRQQPIDCNRCCSSDLCNDKCQESAPTGSTILPTSTPKPTPTYITTSTISKEFVLMFQNNEWDSSTSYSILIGTKEACNISINVPALSMATTKTLDVGSYYIDFAKNSRITPNAGSIENKGIYIKSEKPISVYGLNQRPPNAEAFLVLPVEYLGKVYKIISLQPSIYTSLFMIAATEDGTAVTIKLNSSSSVVVKGTTYNNGDTIRLALDNLDTIEISSDSDLTGTDVISDKRIAVTSGNKCTRVYNDDGWCGPIVEYLTPVNVWGFKFVVPALRPATKFYLKIVASLDYTRVVVTNSISNVTYMTNSDRHLEIIRDSLPVYVKANKPIYVGLITKQTREMSPVFVNIPAISQFTIAYQISTPVQYSPTRTVTVMIESRKKDGLLIDGTKMNSTTTQNIYTPDGDMSIVAFNLNGNYTEVTHEEKGVKFGALVHGVFTYQVYRPAYAYSGGLALRSRDNQM